MMERSLQSRTIDALRFPCAVLVVLCLFAPVIHWILRKTKGWVLALLYPLYMLDIWIPLEGFSAEGLLFFSLGAFLRMNGQDMTAVFGRFKIASYILLPLAITFCVRTYWDRVSWEYARRLRIDAQRNPHCNEWRK